MLAEADFQAGRLGTAFMERFSCQGGRGTRRPAEGRGPAPTILRADPRSRPSWTPTCRPRRLDVPRRARAFLDGGARLIQVRGKHCRAVRSRVVRRHRRARRPTAARIIVNDRPDIARLAGAAGVHVGQDDLPPPRRATLLGPSAIVGLSTHTGAQIERALAEPVTYIAVGPVFGTATKDTGYEPWASSSCGSPRATRGAGCRSWRSAASRSTGRGRAGGRRGRRGRDRRSVRGDPEGGTAVSSTRALPAAFRGCIIPVRQRSEAAFAHETDETRRRRRRDGLASVEDEVDRAARQRRRARREGLRRSLSALDLTLLGIGAIIGTGIFVLTGTAAANQAGPAITISYMAGRAWPAASRRSATRSSRR